MDQEQLEKKVIVLEQEVSNLKKELTQLLTKDKQFEEFMKEYTKLYSMLQQELNLLLKGKEIVKKQEEKMKADVTFKGMKVL